MGKLPAPLVFFRDIELLSKSVPGCVVELGRSLVEDVTNVGAPLVHLLAGSGQIVVVH
jgi:hypothetical protein